MKKFFSTTTNKRYGSRHQVSHFRFNKIAKIFVCLALSLIPFYSRGLQKAPREIPVIDGSSAFLEIGKIPRYIKESSGLEMTSNKNLWTHNDGGVPVLYCLDTLGNQIRALQLNHKNNGWEDLAKDRNGNFYVAGIGNNNNDKKILSIYKIQNPDSIKEKVVNAEIIRFTYDDQTEYPPAPPKRNFDADALIAFDDSLYIFTKNRTEPFSGYTKIYALSQNPGHYVAVAIDSIYLGKANMMDSWVTGASISPDGKLVALLGHSCVWLIEKFPGKQFSKGKITRINLNHLSHKTGICFTDDNKLFISDELSFGLIGGKIYSLDLKIIMNKLP